MYIENNILYMFCADGLIDTHANGRILAVRVPPNHLLLSAHCKDLIKMCKSMTIITIVWMDKYLPIECLFPWFLQSPRWILAQTHTSTHTCFNQFHSPSLFVRLLFIFSVRKKHRVPLSAIHFIASHSILYGFSTKSSSTFEGFRRKGFQLNSILKLELRD